MLAAMSTQLDVAAQDQALALQINQDRATLAALHDTVQSTRDETNVMRHAGQTSSSVQVNSWSSVVRLRLSVPFFRYGP